MLRTGFQIMVSVLVLAGCGGGGGGGNPGAAPVPAPDTLAARSLPSGEVAVTPLGPVVAGSALRLRVTATTATPPATVALCLGTDYDPAAVMTTMAGSGPFEAVLTVPSPKPDGLRAFVRLTFADGSVEETGASDFLLP